MIRPYQSQIGLIACNQCHLRWCFLPINFLAYFLLIALFIGSQLLGGYAKRIQVYICKFHGCKHALSKQVRVQHDIWSLLESQLFILFCNFLSLCNEPFGHDLSLTDALEQRQPRHNHLFYVRIMLDYKMDEILREGGRMKQELYCRAPSSPSLVAAILAACIQIWIKNCFIICSLIYICFFMEFDVDVSQVAFADCSFVNIRFMCITFGGRWLYTVIGFNEFTLCLTSDGYVLVLISSTLQRIRVSFLFLFIQLDVVGAIYLLRRIIDSMCCGFN